jgi:NAD(P)-dependent dehydrogenase (short-subunit alcohol dehydrogenase family)
MNLKGKTAIITGGASGLGEATVIRFHEAGVNVVIADMNDELGKALAAKLGDRAIFVKTNVTSVDEVKGVCQAALDKFGAIHVLINNAGVAGPARTLGKDGPANLDLFKFVVEVNLIGGFSMLSNAAWWMSKNELSDDERGVIINVASIASYDGQIGQASYSASKGGISAMTLPIARDLARNAIRVNTIVPGIFDTPMMAKMPEEGRKSLESQVTYPNRLGYPDEFAKLCQHIVENSLYQRRKYPS